VFTPGSPAEAFDLAQRAADLAEEFQVPALLLTDQYLADTVVDVAPESLVVHPLRRHIVRGDSVPRSREGKYLRHAYTESGISPMAVPGEPGITVVVDSDEHTEDGHLTEDHETRIRMVEKRLRKGVMLAGKTIPPLFTGPPNGDLVLIGFGSTKGVIEETRRILAREGRTVATVHLRQVGPFPAEEIAEIVPRFGVALTVENNARGQLARLIRSECGVRIDGTVLRYDGLPFTPAALAEDVRERI